MATTIEKIQGFLNEFDLKYRVAEGKIALTFDIEGYECPVSGESSVAIVIALDENGEYLSVYSPFAFSAEGVAFQEQAIQACVELCWRTKSLQTEFDPTDGEIRFVVEFPLEDAELTSRQLHRCIKTILHFCKQFTPIFRRAADEGVIDWDGFGRPADIERMELADLMRLVGGVEGLRNLLRERPGTHGTGA